MRYIRHNKAPEELIDWIAQQKSNSVNLHYNALGQLDRGGVKVNVKGAIVTQRLKDQGYLCAYTMVGISENNCHIEHIVPRSASDAAQNPEQTVSYANMLVCYPQDESKGKCAFGAYARENRTLPLTPLHPSCESRIRFRMDGRVEPVNSTDSDVSRILDETGDLLRLNHPRLVLWRREAIHAMLFSAHGSALSISAARRFAKHVLEFTWGEHLRPYCIALAHAANEHANNLEKLGRKKRFSKP